jgi:predicted lipoprotein with Yx(FWY)xxD motif
MDMTTTSHSSRRSRYGLGALALAGAIAVGAVAAPAAVLAQDDAVTVSTATDDLGTYLVGPDGRTLYYFTRDVNPGQSVCSGGCLEAWPALTVAEGQTLAGDESVTGTLGAFARDDGTMQAAYRGRPLYYWAADTEPGQTTGQGQGNVWFVALENGSMPENPPALTLAAASSDGGAFLTGRDGLTIYFFANDTTPGVSVCEGDCLANWPPVTVPPGNSVAAGEGVTGVIGLTTGTDGSTQVTYDGRPLYYYQGDTEAGQTTGDGDGEVWWGADVSGALPS